MASLFVSSDAVMDHLLNREAALNRHAQFLKGTLIIEFYMLVEPDMDTMQGFMNNRDQNGALGLIDTCCAFTYQLASGSTMR